jgi:hypothetical protein
MSDQSVVEIKDPGEAHFEHIYTQIHNRYAGITDFRAKLLDLLPLATGTGAFLLLQRGKGRERRPSAVSRAHGNLRSGRHAGLFVYELRGMQRCRELEKQGRNLEKEMKVVALGPFH